MNSELFVKVMQHFIQHTSASPENPALLLMDNHEFHLSIEALDLAKRSGVCVLTLHPHTTAKLQPLDVGLNGPFKTYYNTAIDSWLRRNPGKQVTIYNVAECVGQAYQKAMTPINISAAFKKCGIFPFNPDIFEDIDFMPSEVTDREAPESSAALLVSHSPPLGNREQPEPSPLSDVTFIESPVPRDAESPSVLEEHEPVVDKSCAVELSAESKNFSVISTREITPPPAVAECSSSGSKNLSVILIREITPPPAVAECSSSVTRGKFIPPKEFMPPLKAGPRSGGGKPRKLGRSLIATDTPEKNEIAEERNKAKQRKSAAKKAKRPVLTDKKRKCKRKKTNDNLLQDDETSEEEDITVVCLSDSDLSNIDDEKEEDSDDDLPLVTGNFNKLDRNPKDGEYVMVCFETKKLLIHYLALITEKISTNTYGVSFMRLKNKSEMKFVMPLEPDLSEIKLSDIKMILPQPKINGTKNRNSTYIFPIRVTPNLNLR
ncbi:hypothetical protein O0L34_g9416 [Tuta absoluta]|nr:hypothetical protein O0L34_g9416 [Tuta absoluta]